MPQIVTSPAVPAPSGTYSHGIISRGQVYIAGQGPFDAAGNLVGVTFAEQLRQTLRNVEAIAQAAGTSLSKAVCIGVYLKTLDDWAELNTLLKEFLVEPYPARTTIQSDLNGFLIEVDAVVEL